MKRSVKKFITRIVTFQWNSNALSITNRPVHVHMPLTVANQVDFRFVQMCCTKSTCTVLEARRV